MNFCLDWDFQGYQTSTSVKDEGLEILEKLPTQSLGAVLPIQASSRQCFHKTAPCLGPDHTTEETTKWYFNLGTNSKHRAPIGLPKAVGSLVNATLL